MELEADALKVAASRARLLDHLGNRGSDVEHTIRDWIRRMVEPDYTASSGEIIDAFDTDADLDSRQQDIIIHQQSIEANAFVLPSGLRLVPIETVAAVVEVKLSLGATEFAEADAAAAQTSRLLLSLKAQDNEPARGVGGVGARHQIVQAFNKEFDGKGAPQTHPELLYRTTFAVFGIDGVKELATLASYLLGANAVRLVACLDAGGAIGQPKPTGPLPPGYERSVTVAGRQDALLSFAQWIGSAVANHRDSVRRFSFESDRYYQRPRAIYRERSGFEIPDWYKPDEWELSGREALFPGKKFKR
jgi:Domain of unknown function (DUF6602)